MRNELLLVVVVLLIWGHSIFMGVKRGFLITILFVIRRILMVVLGYVLWRVILSFMPANTPYLLSGIVYSIALILAGALFRFILSVFRIVDRIPIIKQVNKLLGLIAGLIGGLVNVWILFAIVRVFHMTLYGEMLLESIVKNDFLNLIYQVNPLLPPINSVMNFLEGF